jgi:hypothetical protein
VAGHPVAGAQQVFFEVHSSEVPASVIGHEQVRSVPVQGSNFVPQNPAGHVSGVQHMLASPASAAPQRWLDGQLSVQLKVFPLQGSVHEPAHWLGGQPVAGVQHVVPPLQSSPVGQEQVIIPTHGSLTEPHTPVGQAPGVQHLFKLVPVVPHDCPLLHPQLIGRPVQGSVKSPQKFAGQVACVQHCPADPQTMLAAAQLLGQVTVLPLQSIAVPQLVAVHGSGQAHTLLVHTSGFWQPPQ